MSNRALLLGLDIGTTNIKCLAVDESCKILAAEPERTPPSHPQPGWTDFEPNQIWETVCRTIQAVVSQVSSREALRGLAVASVGESLIPIDSDGHALAPAIAWFDLRTAAEYAWVSDRIGYDRLFRVSGLNPDPMFGICKALWFRNHHPAAFQRNRYWLNLADYVEFPLCVV